MPNAECATTVVKVLPFRLEPDPLVLDPGGKTMLQAWQGNGPVTAAWQAVTKNITVSPSGVVEAGTGPFDGGRATVAATYGGVVEYFDMSIRGNGSEANTAEYYDWLGLDNNNPYGRLALGVFSGPVAIHGDWIYTFSRSIPFYGGPWLSTWIDVYRLDANRLPVWVDSVEAPYAQNSGAGLSVEGDTLYVTGTQADPLLLTFDIHVGRPVLKGRQTYEASSSALHHQGLGFSVNPSSWGSSPTQITLQIADYSTGSSTSLPLDYQPLYWSFDAKAAGSPAGWAAVTFSYREGSDGRETVVVDATGGSAEPFAILPLAA
jgi:hypothetical protein